MTRQQTTQRAFLGAALLDPSRARDYITRMVPAIFDEGVCQDVFTAIYQLTMAGEPVDPVTVVNRAAGSGSKDDVKVAVTQLAETCPSVSNIGG